MSDRRRPLLIVEDDPALQRQMKWAFSQYEVALASDRESALAQLRRLEPAVVTIDLGVLQRPDDSAGGLELLQEVLSIARDTKVIVLTGRDDRTNAVKAIGLGAYDFCPKPLEPEMLALTVERAYRLYELQEENRRLQGTATGGAPSGVLMRAPAETLNLRQLRDEAQRLAVVRALGRVNGNLSKAAELLGVSRPTLYDLLNRFGLKGRRAGVPGHQG